MTGAEQVPTVTLALPLEGAPEPLAGGGVVVEPGSGAVVRAVNGSIVNRGTLYLVDGIGRRYALSGGAAERLGYSEVAPVPVPLTWLAGLPEGPELNGAATAIPPGTT
ncbi:MAG: type VII secretion protein EccB [Kineosporiaceae bacterium]